jgi:hypothetical protein
MVSDEQIKNADKTAANAFEATKRIYDLVFIAWRKITEDIGEQLGLKIKHEWGSVKASFINQYVSLTEAEVNILKRYFYTTFSATKAKKLKDDVVPFILFSIATRKFDQPQLIYGLLRKVNWGQSEAIEIDPFMYEISEKRKQEPLEVRGVNTASKRGTAEVDFSHFPLFAITDDTVGDITSEIVNWFNERLK